MLLEDLQTIGLTHTEATIYTWLLNFGSAKPAEISAANSLKRPTVYSAIAELQKKGIVMVEGGDRSTRVTAQPPHVLQSIVELESEKVQHKKRATQRVIERLSQDAQTQEYIRRDQFQHVDDLTTHITHRVEHLVSEHAIESVMGWAYTDERTAIPFVTLLQDVTAATALEIPVNILSYQKEVVSREIMHEPPLHIKPWIGPELFATNSLLIGDTALYVYKKSGLYHTTEIVDTIVVNQMKSLWSVLWNYEISSAYRNFAI